MEGAMWNFRNAGKRFALALCILIITAAGNGWAQKIQARIKVDLQRLSLDKQQRLEDLAKDIETYINDFDWTGDAPDQIIPVTMQIFLTDQSVSYESRYAGTFYITNNLDIKYYDKYWRFPYQDGDRLMHEENMFHPMTGFIDFYINLILGGEYDKLDHLGGTPFYEKANYINEQAKFNTQFAYGWEERSRLIEKIMSDDYQPYRLVKDQFFLGMAYVGESDTTARRHCHEAIKIMEQILRMNPEDAEIMGFLEAHHLEIVELFRGENEVLGLLARIDPAREEKYRDHMAY